MISVSVQNNGIYVIPDQKLNDLLRWLASNQASELQEVAIKPANYEGKDLING